MKRKPLVALAAIALLVPVLAAMPSASQSTGEDLQCGESQISQALPNGAQWRMCARIHQFKGLVLEQIEFKPASGEREYSGFKRVIDEIYLAQLNVPYDTGYVQYDDITSFGFGDQHLMPQNQAVCEGEALDVEQTFTYQSQLVNRTIPGICLTETSTGIATHSQEDDLGEGTQVTAQGRALEVTSLSKIAWYEYQQKIIFDDHGGIDVGLGATGDLPNGDPETHFWRTDSETGWPVGGPRASDDRQTYSSSHWHSAIWRIDFGIDGGSDQFVEQWDYQTRAGDRPTPVTSGHSTTKTAPFYSLPGEDHNELTWWRVGSNSSLNPDGHRRSYEVVNQNTPNTSIPVTAPLITATNRRDCEEYASKNLNPSCPNLSILDYVEQDDEPLSDPVLWINAGFHHIVRDEDQSPMPIHWQRFQLVPRDFFAQSPSVTDARSCINGPSGDINSTSRPCVATSVSRPRITPTSAAPGTTLTTTNGLWVQNRTTWNYGYMWHRDGEPILDPATSEPETRNTYTVTEADAGHDLTVKVYAHKPGFTTGVATSSAITIPGPPRPSAGPTPTASTTTATPPQPTRSAAPKMRTSRIVAASRKKVASKKSAKLTVTVRSTGGYVPTGRVTVSRKSKAVSARLSRGRVVLRLPKITRRGTYTFTITYHGDSRAKKSTSRVRVQVTRR